MNTLKVVRAIAVGTALLAGILTILMILFTGTALRIGVTDGQFLVTVIVFLISTLYWLAVDALIRRDAAESEAVKKIHQTTFNQAAILMILCILGSISLVFL
jgi:uncharacterized membrane protein